MTPHPGPPPPPVAEGLICRKTSSSSAWPPAGRQGLIYRITQVFMLNNIPISILLRIIFQFLSLLPSPLHLQVPTKHKFDYSMRLPAVIHIYFSGAKLPYELGCPSLTFSLTASSFFCRTCI